MHVLYLQRNYINYLSPSCFTKVLILLVINLEGNPLVDIADDAFKDMSLYILLISDTLLTSITGRWIDGFNNLTALDNRRVKLNYFSHAAVNRLNELETVYTDDLKLCCIVRNMEVCHDNKSIHLRCSLLLFPVILRPIFICSTIIILFFTTMSLWVVANRFTITRSVQCLLYYSILINRSLCVFYVLATEILDIFHGKHNIFWYRLLSSKLFCQGLRVIFSSAILMSNISTSLLDHIAYMALM